MSNQLTDLRKEIEKLDEEIISLLARRFHLTGEIGKIKTEKGMEIEDEEREDELFAMYEDWAREKGLEPAALTRIFKKIFEESRLDQENQEA